SSKTLVVGWYSGTAYWIPRDPSVVSPHLGFVLENWPFCPTVWVSSLGGRVVPSARLCLVIGSWGPSWWGWGVSPVLPARFVLVLLCFGAGVVGRDGPACNLVGRLEVVLEAPSAAAVA